ncbi:hypothetical protein QS257_10040 [Terrilactibacillus sp. S3-3]|nr:hypothetical protein QS257_10040 [Terrilactibacillus sp. S3-3]
MQKHAEYVNIEVSLYYIYRSDIMLNSFEWVTTISPYQGIIALVIFLVFLLARKLFTAYFLKK